MIKHLIGTVFLGVLLVLLSSCSDYSSIDANFKGEIVVGGADFTLKLSSSKQLDLEVFSEVKNTIMLVSYGEKIKGIDPMVLPDRKGNRKTITLNQNQSHTIKVSAKFLELPDGQLRLDFGELGYLFVPSFTSFGLGVVVFPSVFSYFSENEGIASNFINVVVENGKVRELSNIPD